VELGSRNAKLHFDLAMLRRSLQEGDETVIGLLRRALELQPDYLEARYRLGFQLYARRDYDGAVQEFLKIRSLDHERAVPMFCALAYSLAQTGKLEEAQKAAQRARELARTDRQIEDAQRALQVVAYARERSEGGQVLPSFPAASEEGRPRIARKNLPPSRVAWSSGRRPSELAQDDRTFGGIPK
jgi:tetratricopeptide (TPR) repeat protein